MTQATDGAISPGSNRSSSPNVSSSSPVSCEQIAERVERLIDVERPRHQRLLAYCRNSMRVCGATPGSSSDRPYRQAQEWGLPQRITGVRSGAIGDIFDDGDVSEEIARKEVVIENDIGWRVEAMVDYLFGKPIVIESAAPDPQRRAMISELLRQILAHNGGILMLQQLALIGAVHGFVDVLVKLEPATTSSSCAPESAQSPCGLSELGQPPPAMTPAMANSTEKNGPSTGAVRASGEGGADGDGGASSPAAGSAPQQAEAAQPAASVLDDRNIAADTRAASSNDSLGATLSRLARMVRLEVVEPARALPFLSHADYRDVVAYGQCWEVASDACSVRDAASRRAKRGWFERMRDVLSGPARSMALRTRADERDFVVELITPTSWLRYENEKLVAQGANSLGRIPLVHVQNSPVPFEYAGGSDVATLIPLQDELNTRLSDRASRITLQSFKMYLGKGIEEFTSMPVAPGRMWTSDNENADVIEFGGDASCPSEESHISDGREAMDKTSAVTPIAAGAIKNRIENQKKPQRTGSSRPRRPRPYRLKPLSISRPVSSSR